MTALIGEVTKRLPDRWLAGTLAPGLLWLAVAVLAVRLGHAHPFSPAELARAARYTGALIRDQLAEAVAFGLLAIGAAVVVSSVARLAGAVTRSLWLGRWRGPLAEPAAVLTRWRRDRAEARLAAAGTRLPADYLPRTPTWIGDRLRLADVRVSAQYGLSLALIWPRIWQLVDVDTRTLVQQARARFELAGTLAGWSACYLVLVVFWWPAALVAGVLLGVAWWRGRLAAAVFGDTIESTVDLQHRALAAALGYPVAQGKPLPSATADAINDQLHKGATPQPHGDSGPTEAIS
jgi:hypothetical protein